MIAIGVDLGGTKLEVQLFDKQWQVVARNRVATPTRYQALVTVLASQIEWADRQAGKLLPVGIGAPGLINPVNGLALTANVCATGHPLPADIARTVQRPVTYMNDCRALALSEVTFGAGRGHRIALSMVLGTGIGGGITVDGNLLQGATNTGGEFGHISLSGYLLKKYNLPVVSCGCGRDGCVETYASGPGLSRLAEIVVGAALSPQAIVEKRQTDSSCRDVWNIWCELTADLLRSLTLTADPDIIVLAGGLSKIENITDDLSLAARAAQIGGFGIAPIVLAQGGDSSGARGAALAAYKAVYPDYRFLTGQTG